jgi:hypothetical protein
VLPLLPLLRLRRCKLLLQHPLLQPHALRDRRRLHALHVQRGRGGGGHDARVANLRGDAVNII